MKTLDWKAEMGLLNDQQLKRIVFAEKDDWGWDYYHNKDNGLPCCVKGHICDPSLDHISHHNVRLEYERLIPNSKLENHYICAWDNRHQSIIHPEIITEIQDYARELLKQRNKTQIAPDARCERSIKGIEAK